MIKLFETGRVCVKTMGRETGSYCVIVSKVDETSVIVTGPKNLSGVRRRPCNIKHLEPLETVLPISKESDDSTVEKAISDAGLTEKFRSKIRFTP